MSTGFPGFPSEALTFFRGLARNNNREWFLPRKPLFEEKVKRPMWELVEALNTSMKEFAPEYVTDPAKAIYRFYRDTRFSKDKSPYKDHIAASFSRRGLSCEGAAGYYVAVSHKNVGIGGGVYMTMPQTLLTIRHHIAEHAEEFRRTVGARAMKSLFGDMQGEQLSRVPKGFPKDHPAEDILRFKQLFFFAELPAELATTPGIYPEVKKRFRAMAPFMEFLNAPLVQAQKRPAIPHG
ncbi:MAG TPA: DUF2461 domain-containing protein [Bryobacteraceae bacterium]|nr:DUF2461 domain-containing protein [Bryobacteraceae bacterium]